MREVTALCAEVRTFTNLRGDVTDILNMLKNSTRTVMATTSTNGANITNSNYDKAASSTTVAQSTISASEVLYTDESKGTPYLASDALANASNASSSEASCDRAVAKKPVVGLSTTRKLKTISVTSSYRVLNEIRKLMK